MIAIYPGTFDPPTNGHFDIIRRGAGMFEKLYVAVAANPDKNTLFTGEERMALLQASLGTLPNVDVSIFNGLAVDFASAKNAKVVLRGVRSVADYEYELQMAIANRSISGGSLETILMLPNVQHSFISSRLVREAAMFDGSISHFVPPHIQLALKKKFGFV